MNCFIWPDFQAPKYLKNIALILSKRFALVQTGYGINTQIIVLFIQEISLDGHNYPFWT